VQPALQTHEGEEFLEKGHPFDRHIITVQVMAVSDVSPPNQHTVRTVLKCSQHMMRGYGGRTHHPYRSYIRGVLEPAHTGQIGCAVGAPVAHKGYNFRLKMIFSHLYLHDQSGSKTQRPSDLGVELSVVEAHKDRRL
jgi:hypothetical protein